MSHGDKTFGGSKSSASSGACTKEGERDGAGLTKECIYSCGLSRRVITVSSTKICPISP